ncbi:MAG: lipopolysaccharide kinase InaA family protein [Planctomycetota bacterium]|nr:lipopolysaccharide kinase InaA family protein [Planctomycetota bacterium]
MKEDRWGAGGNPELRRLRILQRGQYRVEALPGYEEIEIESLPWDDLERLRAIGEVIKATRSRKVLRACLMAGDRSIRDLYIKRYNFKASLTPYLKIFSRSRARNEWDMMWALRARGFLTPRPAILIERNTLPPGESIIATEAIRDAHPADALVARASGRRRHELLAGLGRFLAVFHGQGFYHDDMRASHLWIRGSGGDMAVYVLDLLNARLRPRLSGAARARNLYQFLHSLNRIGLSDADRLSFLRGYGGDAGSARRWMRRIAMIGLLKRRFP